MKKVWYKSELIFSSGPSFNDYHYIIPPRLDDLKLTLSEEWGLQYSYSEHYRGVRLTICEGPSKEWLIDKIEDMRRSIESLNHVIKLYEDELHKPD